MTLIVNGRFLKNPRPTGMHRVGRALIDAGRAAGLPLRVLAPPGVLDPRVDATPWGPPGRLGAHAWEQGALPIAARRRALLSLLNTTPVALARAAVMVHDLAWRADPHWHARSIRFYGALVEAGARRARVVLTPSRAVADEVRAARLSGGAVTVVRPAVDPAFTAASAADVDAVRRDHGLERPYLLMTGWQHPRKDAATAIAAHLELVGSSPHDLVLVGTGSPTFGAVDLPRRDSVRQLGFVPDERLVALMTGAAGFLYPSLYEGFGLPPLEALACGTPALVSDLPVLRETTGDAAVLVAAGDVRAWRLAMAEALRGGLVAGTPPAWTWADAGAQLAEAVAPLL